MTDQDSKFLHKYIQEAAKKMEGKLPDHPSHPYGRIPIAHCYHVIQSIMEKPAKQCRGERLPEMLEIVDFCVEHVEDMSITRQIKHKYDPEPQEDDPATLSQFLE